MAPRQNYSENEMRRMQHDAVARVQEMQSRARMTVDQGGEVSYVPPQGYNGRNFRNWSTNPNIQHPKRRPQTRQQQQAPPPPPPQPEPEEHPETAAPPPPEPPVAETSPPEGTTTLIQDILGAIGLDDDRLLVIGLLFILINAKADTTLILALIYLLI